MTFELINHEFCYFYPLFQSYWNFVIRHFNRELPVDQFAILTWRIKDKIKKEWLSFKWDLDELDWICNALDERSFMLNPYNFLNSPIAYVDHAKTCYLSQSS